MEIKEVSKDLQKAILNLDRQFLHAKTLGFFHPIKKKNMIFNSKLPKDLLDVLKTLKNTEK